MTKAACTRSNTTHRSTSAISPTRPGDAGRPSPRTTRGRAAAWRSPRARRRSPAPRAARLRASDRVAAAIPPFVSDASVEGRVPSAWSTRLVVMLTTWPPPCSTIGARTSCVMWKKRPGSGHRRREVVLRVIREGLADEDARVVHEGVDAAEPVGRRGHHAAGGDRRGDVAGHGQHVAIPAGADRAGRRDHREAGAPETVDEPAPIPSEAPVTMATLRPSARFMHPSTDRGLRLRGAST